MEREMEETKEDVLKEQKHILERLLLDPKVQKIAGWLSKPGGNGRTPFERLMYSFDNPRAPLPAPAAVPAA